MSANLSTHIYCFDDHRIFTEEIRKKFDDPSRYVIYSFQTYDELLNKLSAEKEEKYCKVAVLGVHDSKDQVEIAEHFTEDIRRNNPHLGIVIVCPPDKPGDLKKNMNLNIDSLIQHNSNFSLRFHNIVKKLQSEHNIMIHKTRRNRSLLVLLGFITISIILTIIAKFNFPEFF